MGALPAPLPACGVGWKAGLGVEHAAWGHLVSFPSLSSLWVPCHGCHVSEPFWCSQVTFSSISLHLHHHELPALLYRQTLLFPSSHLSLERGWGTQCWHLRYAGVGTCAAPKWAANCWCLQVGSFMTLVCTPQKSESKILGSPTRPPRHPRLSHLWGPPSLSLFYKHIYQLPVAAVS